MSIVKQELVLLMLERYLQHQALGLAPEEQALVQPWSEETGFGVPAKQLDPILQHQALGLAPEEQALVQPWSEETGFGVPAKQLDPI